MSMLKYYIFVKSRIKKILPSRVKHLISYVPRKLKLTSMGKVLKELERRGVQINKLEVLELFARAGDWHTMDYVPYVKSVEAWEIDPSFKKALRQNLPFAKVRITDSIRRVKKINEKFDLIVTDNSEGIYGEKNQYCEHFDIYQNIFRILKDSGIIILNIIPKFNHEIFEQFPHLQKLVNKDYLNRRSLFYKTNYPKNISLDRMIRIYRKIVNSQGFFTEWYFIQKRNSAVSYLVLKVKKSKIKK